MSDKICKIKEIRDDKHGADIVNDLLQKGWTFISACQVGTPDHMDIIYVVGATEDVCNSEDEYPSILSNLVNSET